MNVDIVNDFFLIKKIMDKGYEKSVCKIEIEDENQKDESHNMVGTGFFCKIPSINKIFFITCHHNLEKNFENLKKLILKFDYLTEENWEKTIEFDLKKERIKILNEKFDFIAIEVLKDDNIHGYITADEDYINVDVSYSFEKKNFTKVKTFISHFPKDKDNEKNKHIRLKFSLGIINGESKRNSMLIYSGWTADGTAGAPIISVENQELIAIHKGSYTKYNFEKSGVGYPMYLIISKIKENLNNKKEDYKKEEDKKEEDKTEKDKKEEDKKEEDKKEEDKKEEDKKEEDNKDEEQNGENSTDDAATLTDITP